MKHRLILVLGLLAVSLGIVAGSAFASGRGDGDRDGGPWKTYTVTYCVNGTTMVLKAHSEYAEMFATSVKYGHPVYMYTITKKGDYGDRFMRDGGKGKTKTETTYSFKEHQWIKGHKVHGVLISLASGACSGAGTSGMRADTGVFLCYSAYQLTPGVWPSAQAKALVDEGYWLAYAVSGNMPGGVNVGDHHLTCNLAAAQSVTGTLIGGDGTVVGSDYSDVFGFYPVVGQ